MQVDTDVRQYDLAVARTFDSFTEYVEFGKGERPDRNSGKNASTEAGTPKGKSWDLNTGLQGALELAEAGWSDVRDEMEAMTNDIASRVQQVTRLTLMPRMDVVGVAVDVGAYMTGEPECMVLPELKQMPTDSPVVTLAVNVAASCSVDAKDLRKRGAVILALVEVLRIVGIPAEIWMLMEVTQGATDSFTHAVRLLATDQPIDTDEIAFALAHPAAFRRIGFAAMERETEVDIGWGYGIPRKDPSSWTTEVLRPTVSVGGGRSGDGNLGEIITKPVDWILETLKGLGLDVGDDE